MRAAARLHAGRPQRHRRRPAAQAAGAAASITRSPRGCAGEGYGRRWSCRAPGSRRWRRSSPAFRERTGFAGELRFGLLNDMRFGERQLPRMIDRCGALALPQAARRCRPTGRCPNWRCRSQPRTQWRSPRGLPDDGRPVVALAPGAVGPSKRWPCAYFAELARSLTGEGRGGLGAGQPGRGTARGRDRAHRRAAGPRPDLDRPAQRHPGAPACQRLRCRTTPALSMSPPQSARPTIGIFGPTSPWHWAPLNPLAAVIETTTDVPCRPCHKPVCRLRPSPLHARHPAGPGAGGRASHHRPLAGAGLIAPCTLLPPPVPTAGLKRARSPPCPIRVRTQPSPTCAVRAR